MKPSFINPNHTSLSLNKNTKYENPNIDTKTKEVKKKRGGWDDDEEESTTKNNNKVPVTYFRRDENKEKDDKDADTKKVEENSSNHKVNTKDIKKEPIENKPVFTV